MSVELWRAGAAVPHPRDVGKPADRLCGWPRRAGRGRGARCRRLAAHAHRRCHERGEGERADRLICFGTVHATKSYTDLGLPFERRGGHLKADVTVLGRLSQGR